MDFTGHGIGKFLVPLMVRREARKEMPGNLATLKWPRSRRGWKRAKPAQTPVKAVLAGPGRNLPFRSAPQFTANLRRASWPWPGAACLPRRL